MENFEDIFKEFHHSLFLYALKFIDNDEDALDIVQEVFSNVWEKKKYKLEKEHLKYFLFSSVKNGCLNYIKHQGVVLKHIDQEKRELALWELYQYKSGEKSLIEKEDLQKIYSAIDSLTDMYKEVLVLSRFEGLKNKEIAQKLNIPIRTVETRLYRSLLELKNKLSERLIHIFFNYRTL